MRRYAALPLCVCLASPFWSGCQTTQQTAQVEPTPPGSFWSADGQSANTELVSNRDGEAKIRFASRPRRDGSTTLSNLLPGSGSDRIPLPRTDEGRLRDIETERPNEQPIGAF
ncbi:MAG: hypothetical protein WBC44_17755 [Planctomycetaceae bacterium]